MELSPESLYERFLNSTGACTDTRAIKDGQMFFALKGPNFNGNKYAKQALEKGAAYAVIDEVEYQEDGRFLLVEDTLKALQDMAQVHRRMFHIPVLALTGSNGKTTTKELMRAVISQKYNTLATEGNLNNHIGVPLTLLNLKNEHEFAIIEMGANKLGDIRELCEIAEPTHGLITNIGKAHLGPFGGFEQIIRAKSEMYQHLLSHRGTVFINAENPILSNMAKRFKDPVMYLGEGNFYGCRLVEASPFATVETENGNTIHSHLLGAYNFENIATALCVGKFFKVPAEDAERAIAEYIPENNRSQLVKGKTNLLISDAYNANPASMEAALRNLAGMKAEKKIAILGDMLELGDESPAEHARIGALSAELGIDKVYFCGPHMKSAKAENPEAEYFEKKDDLAVALKNDAPENATILLKGSRGMSLESLTKLLLG
ncbi:UDP-N-acetylmuramoyl-tripeptide--D-alanyl-D-alanine ligase [Fulvitalea axinellae]|uniref:UDP-N-acetylmuramoyl-tripeptide--D-alanyl-D-alanine ligase n=1 Tax=Fulvitalea axinellae TaxID=1182444 RepID=A0AAU9CL01_9BACT|nr:UDP-N-acetylmuramoyl-tripeptide--D-alanyl-D-alanine ligase [Fulvitalea axinellae]